MPPRELLLAGHRDRARFAQELPAALRQLHPASLRGGEGLVLARICGCPQAAVAKLGLAAWDGFRQLLAAQPGLRLHEAHHLLAGLIKS